MSVVVRAIVAGSWAAVLFLAHVQEATSSPGAWQTPVAVSPASGLILDSLVGSDSAGGVTVAWDDLQDGGIWVGHRTPEGKWGKALDVDPLGFAGLAMDEDPAGDVCLLYARWHRGDVLTTTCAGPDGRFSRPQTLSAHTPYRDYQLVVDGHDNWAAAWTQRDSAGRLRIAVARRVSGSWRKPVMVTGPRQGLGDFDLTTSPQGTLTLAWAARPRHHRRDPYRVFSRTRPAGARWRPQTVLSGPGSPTPELASGPGEQTRVVWLSRHDGVQRLETRTHTSGSWTPAHTLVRSRPGQPRIWLGEVASGGRDTSVVTWGRASTPTVRGGLYAALRQHGRWGVPQPLTRARGASDPLTVVVNHSGTVGAFWEWAKRSQWSNGTGWTIQGRVHQAGAGWTGVQNVSSANATDMFPASATLLPTDLPALTWVSAFPKEGWAYRTMYSQAD